MPHTIKPIDLKDEDGIEFRRLELVIEQEQDALQTLMTKIRDKYEIDPYNLRSIHLSKDGLFFIIETWK